LNTTLYTVFLPIGDSLSTIYRVAHSDGFIAHGQARLDAVGAGVEAVRRTIVNLDASPIPTARAAPGWLCGLSAFHRKSILYGAFVWARRALNGPKRWFLALAGLPARAPAARGHRQAARGHLQEERRLAKGTPSPALFSPRPLILSSSVQHAAASAAIEHSSSRIPPALGGPRPLTKAGGGGWGGAGAVRPAAQPRRRGAHRRGQVAAVAPHLPVLRRRGRPWGSVASSLRT
jgi:hypothetical protein